MCKYFFRAPLFVDTVFTYKTEVGKIFKAWRLNVSLVLYFFEHCNKETGTFMYILCHMPKLR